MKRQADGFTLIELLIVIAVIGILAAIAVPNYRDYVTRSKFQDATSVLSTFRLSMEQYYLDNRHYGPTVPNCGVPNPSSKYFTYACVSTVTPGAPATGFRITATGKSGEGLGSFVFSIDETNIKRTEGVPSGWTLPTENCWIRKKGGEC